MTGLKLKLTSSLLALVLVGIIVTQLSLLAGGVIALLAAIVAGAALGRVVVDPMADVARGARALASGNYSARVQRSSGEAGYLADAFNRMAQQVEDQVTTAAQERSRLTATLNSSMDAVVALDRNGRVLFANFAAQELLGEPGKGILDSQIAWLLPDERVVQAVRASRDQAAPSVDTIERPGHRFFRVVTTSIIGGGEWAVLVVIHDVTDVQRTEQMRRDFVANVSHELRSPLAGIKVVIETLAEGAIEDPSIAPDFLRRADEEVDRLIQLVEELLELSRIESGELRFNFEDTDVAGLVRDVVGRIAPQAERKHINLVNEVASSAGAVRLDPVRMERALLNLVHNAIKFTPEEGEVRVSATRDQHELRIVIHDTGPGIDPQDMPRVFERFYKADASRTSSGGSGIGLAIVKHTVEAHNGRVLLESSRGNGATFTVELPVTR